MVDPKRKALMKPFELIGISAVFGAFVGFIVVYTMGIEHLLMGLVAGGGTFIIAIVVLAMLVLSYRPNADATHYLDRFEDEAEATPASPTPADDLIADASTSERDETATPANGPADEVDEVENIDTENVDTENVDTENVDTDGGDAADTDRH